MVQAVVGRFLRHRKDGTIYGYTDIMAKNPAVEEVTEQEAYPERFKPKKQTKRKTKIDMSVSDETVDAAEAASKSKGRKKNAGLSTEASKGL